MLDFPLAGNGNALKLCSGEKIGGRGNLIGRPHPIQLLRCAKEIRSKIWELLTEFERKDFFLFSDVFLSCHIIVCDGGVFAGYNTPEWAH